MYIPPYERDPQAGKNQVLAGRYVHDRAKGGSGLLRTILSDIRDTFGTRHAQSFILVAASTLAVVQVVGLILRGWHTDARSLIEGGAIVISFLVTIILLLDVILELKPVARKLRYILLGAVVLCLVYLPGGPSVWAIVVILALLLQAGIMSNFLPFAIYTALVTIGAVAGFWRSGNIAAAIGFVAIFFSFLGGYYVASTLLAELRLERTTSERARHSATDLVAANMQLEYHATRILEQALMTERQRLAREVHDVLGHSLTAVAVQLQNCLIMLANQPELVEEEIATALGVIRASLTEVRSYVSSLRKQGTDKLHGRADWMALCEMFARCTGVHIQNYIDEDFAVIDRELNETVHRIIQEGLTNAYRHGYATLVRVDVWRRGDRLRIKLSDNGIGVAKLHEGNGLMGMRERITRYGGFLTWDSRLGAGFDLGVELAWVEENAHG